MGDETQDEVMREAGRTEARRSVLAAKKGERLASEARETAALQQRLAELTKASADAQLLASRAQARVKEMQALQKVVLPVSKRLWKVVQLVVRAALAGCVLVGLLALPVQETVRGGAVLGLIAAGVVAAWWGSDLADYLELSRDE